MPIIVSIMAGEGFTEEEIIETDYFQKYIRRLHPGKGIREMSEREKRHFLGHFNDTIHLLNDIKVNGVKDTLDFIETIDGNRYMLRGYRRLVIAKALKIKRIKVKIIPEIGIMSFLESGGYIG